MLPLQSSDGSKITQTEFCKFVNRFMKVFKEQGKRHLEDPEDMSANEKEAYVAHVALGGGDRQPCGCHGTPTEHPHAHFVFVNSGTAARRP